MKKLLAMLNNEDIQTLNDEYLLQMKCVELMQNQNAHIKLALDNCRRLSILRSKNIEWDCVQRINSILELCRHGRI
jgi:hypothetical protein